MLPAQISITPQSPHSSSSPPPPSPSPRAPSVTSSSLIPEYDPLLRQEREMRCVWHLSVDHGAASQDRHAIDTRDGQPGHSRGSSHGCKASGPRHATPDPDLVDVEDTQSLSEEIGATEDETNECIVERPATIALASPVTSRDIPADDPTSNEYCKIHDPGPYRSPQIRREEEPCREKGINQAIGSNVPAGQFQTEDLTTNAEEVDKIPRGTKRKHEESGLNIDDEDPSMRPDFEVEQPKAKEQSINPEDPERRSRTTERKLGDGVPAPEHEPSLLTAQSLQITHLRTQLSDLQAELRTRQGDLLKLVTPSTSDASAIVKGHIRLLHRYNELKDMGSGMLGLIADARGVRVGDIYGEFGLGVGD